MTGQELLDLVRLRLDDAVEPYLWSDAELLSYLNEGIREAADRARLLPFNTEEPIPAIDPVGVSAGDPMVELHELITEIDRVVWVSQGHRRKLEPTSIETLDRSYGANWETLVGHPVEYIYDPPYIRLFRTPSVDGTIQLRGWRLPEQEVRSTTPIELPRKHHERLADWVLFRAYSKQDADTMSPDAAAKAEAAFVQSFGYRHDAHAQRKRADRREHIVQYAGY